MNLMQKIKNVQNRKALITVYTLALLCIVSMTLIGFVIPKDITILDAGKKIEVTTSRIYVAELLAEQNIALRAGDRISISPHAALRHNDTVIIERANKIVLTADGETKNIYSCETTVSDALADCGITLSKEDEVTPALETTVTNGMQVKVCRIQVYEETRTEVIPMQTVIRPNYEARANHSVILEKGQDGSETVTYKVTTCDGEEISREALSRTVIKEPVTQVMEKGLQGAKIVATSAEELKVKEIIDCSATAYTAYSGAKTASGRVAAYGIVAVDPRVIPLGTKLYIEAVDGSWTYGYAVAGDTGGAIKGKKVDLFYNSNSTCYQFGRRPARVYVLE